MGDRLTVQSKLCLQCISYQKRTHTASSCFCTLTLLQTIDYAYFRTHNFCANCWSESRDWGGRNKKNCVALCRYVGFGNGRSTNRNKMPAWSCRQRSEKHRICWAHSNTCSAGSFTIGNGHVNIWPPFALLFPAWWWDKRTRRQWSQDPTDSGHATKIGPLFL